MFSQRPDTRSIKKKEKHPRSLRLSLASAHTRLLFACPQLRTCRPHVKSPSFSVSQPHPPPGLLSTSRVSFSHGTHSQLSPRHAPSATKPASACIPLENVGSAPPISQAPPASLALPLDVDWAVERVRSAGSQLPGRTCLLLFCHRHAS